MSRHHPLFDKYPQLFREKDLPDTQTCMCWGIGTGPGWNPLLEDLCAKLHKLFTDAGLTGEDYPAVCQVKEKFGGLRFYMNAIPQSVQKQAYDFITEAEERSMSTCEKCGAPGETRSGGWIKVLCDEHAPKPGKEFVVYMNGLSCVKGHIVVNAKDAEEAKRIALQKTGDVEWVYVGLVDTEEPIIETVLESYN